MPPPHPRGLHPGDQLDYVERTTSLTVTATVEASGDLWIQGNEIQVDGGTKIKIEAFSPTIQARTSGFVAVNLWEDSTNLGWILQAAPGSAASLVLTVTTYGVRFRTPSAGKHTYKLTAYKGASGSGAHSVEGGTGAAGAYVPAYLRVSVA